MAEPECGRAEGNPIPGGNVRVEGHAGGLDAILAGLDHASRRFAARLGRLGSGYGASRARGDGGSGETSTPAPSAPLYSNRAPEDDLDRRMREAEQEARRYLEQAKRRADSLVTTMIAAVEREASEIRREAEEGMRQRWNEVEVVAGRYIDEAERVAQSMVAERQQRIGELSGVICSRAEVLTSGMEDADEVRRQFDSFVRALSITADRIAGGAAYRRGSPIRGVSKRNRAEERASLAA